MSDEQLQKLNALVTSANVIELIIESISKSIPMRKSSSPTANGSTFVNYFNVTYGTHIPIAETPKADLEKLYAVVYDPQSLQTIVPFYRASNSSLSFQRLCNKNEISGCSQTDFQY